MTREESIKQACEIVALAYHSIGDYSRPSDGFCQMCENLLGKGWHYQNSGDAIEYVRLAVVSRLKRDGYKIADGFDPVTGEAA